MNWTDLWNTLIGIIVGFSLVKGSDLLGRSQRKKAHRAAIAAEIEKCVENANSFLNDSVESPSYRLPTLIYTNSLPQLLADGALKPDQTKSLVDFFNQVEALNIGLHQANEAITAENKPRREAEYKRTRLKATDLVNKYYPPARDAVAPIGRWAQV